MQIEALSGMVDAIARSRGAKTVVDVGSGQVPALHFWKNFRYNQSSFERNN